MSKSFLLKICIIMLLSTGITNCYAQAPVKLVLKDIEFKAPNQVDAEGNRIGYWVVHDSITSRYIYSFYVNGRKEGIELIYSNLYFSYYSKAPLYYLNYIIHYKNGIIEGSLTRFDSDGSIDLYVDSIGSNVYFQEEAKQYGFMYPKISTRQGHFYSYDKDENGKIKLKEDSWKIYYIYDEFELGDSEKVGTTNIYNEDGTVTHISNKPGRVFKEYNWQDSLLHKQKLKEWYCREGLTFPNDYFKNLK